MKTLCLWGLSTVALAQLSAIPFFFGPIPQSVESIANSIHEAVDSLRKFEGDAINQSDMWRAEVHQLPDRFEGVINRAVDRTFIHVSCAKESLFADVGALLEGTRNTLLDTIVLMQEQNDTDKLISVLETFSPEPITKDPLLCQPNPLAVTVRWLPNSVISALPSERPEHITFTHSGFEQDTNIGWEVAALHEETSPELGVRRILVPFLDGANVLQRPGNNELSLDPIAAPFGLTRKDSALRVFWRGRESRYSEVRLDHKDTPICTHAEMISFTPRDLIGEKGDNKEGGRGFRVVVELAAL